MCYSVDYLTKRSIDYAKRRGYDEATVKELEKEFDSIREAIPPHIKALGFSHPELPAFSNEAPFHVTLLSWGLVPFWVKSEDEALQIRKKTLNARGETLFDKPAFREAAKKRRCLIMVDAFYEYYHSGHRAYPFRIRLKNEEPMVLGGIWEHCVLPEGKEYRTLSIVTTAANELLAKIHNRPRGSKDPRMPLILTKELEDEWLMPGEEAPDRKRIEALIRPYDAGELEAEPLFDSEKQIEIPW